MADLITPSSIVAFWKEAGPDKWYAKDERFDWTVRERLRAAHWNAAAGRLNDWVETAEGALALLIVLDQYPRNSFRGSGHQFATDGLALKAAKDSIARGWPAAYEPDLRQFFYLPYEHSERLADHDELVPLLGDDMAEVKRYAVIHRDIIVRFGRFPHRNACLGRETTPEEQAFLDEGGFAG
jgi:uncharacterized protein (DUF924 family)